MPIRCKRVFQPVSKEDGQRVLVDRLWPRGLGRKQAHVDDWLREVAPSGKLRRGLHGGELGWNEFRLRYLAELKQHRPRLRELARRARRESITLLFASRNEKRNNAVVLKEYLQRLAPSVRRQE